MQQAGGEGYGLHVDDAGDEMGEWRWGLLLLLALAPPLPWPALLVSPSSPPLDGDLDGEEGDDDKRQAPPPAAAV